MGRCLRIFHLVAKNRGPRSVTLRYNRIALNSPVKRLLLNSEGQMPVTLGLDVGSNSVGSAWVDSDKREIVAGVSVFPAGVEETDTKRGDPKNKKRRDARAQ